ncbi:MAG TPA: SRPBCC family protein, partial [Actinomycetota bacterium]
MSERGPAPVVTVERYVKAPPETVFTFFADPSRWLQWQGVHAQIEPRPGGRFRMDVMGDGYASGRFVEVTPPRRVVFTWGYEAPGSPVPPGSSTVEIDLLPDGDGTLVRLTHRGLPT